jgi:hypothetical protein
LAIAEAPNDTRSVFFEHHARSGHAQVMRTKGRDVNRLWKISLSRVFTSRVFLSNRVDFTSQLEILTTTLPATHNV